MAGAQTYNCNCPSCGQLHALARHQLGSNLNCGQCGFPFVFDAPLKAERAEEKRQAEKDRRIKRETRRYAKEREKEQHATRRRKEKARREDLRLQKEFGKAIDDLDAESEPTQPAKQPDEETESTISLITLKISGKPKWVIASVVAAVVLGVLPFLYSRNQGAEPGSIVATPISRSRAAGVAGYKGLGWSLDDIEVVWGGHNGWYWSDMQRQGAGVGIKYYAKNTAIKGFEYQVEGLPDNIESFSVGYTVHTGTGLGDEEILIRLSAPIGMVAKVSGVDSDELGSWIGAILVEMLKAREPHSVKTTQEFGSIIGASFYVREGGITISVAVHAN